MFRVIASAVDSLLAKKSFAAKSAYFDVEPDKEGFCLVIRSNDKHRIGETNEPSEAEYVFNDVKGEPVRFIVAVSDNRAALQRAADDLIHFYAAPVADSFSKRHDAMGEHARAILPVAIAVFGLYSRMYIRATGKKTGWRVGSWQALGATRAKCKTRKAITAEAHFAALSDAVADVTGQVQSPEMVALIAKVMARVNAPSHQYAA